MILQHGFLGGGGYWAPVMAKLATMFDVVAPDLPGFAGSAAEPIPGSISGYADALIGLADSLGVDRFSLVGHSMGGMIAQQVAISHPGRLNRLVLYGTAPSGDLPTRFESWEQTIARFQTQGAAAAADVVASWFVDGRRHPYYAFTEDAGRGFNVAAAVNAMKIVPQWDVRQQLGEITAQTLIITGDRDYATTPRQAFALWESIPSTSLCIVPGCSHALHLENTDVFNSIVGTFLLTGR
ncbi:MAG: alpha/beta hydrolase [Betaproteobacteria bacterium]